MEAQPSYSRLPGESARAFEAAQLYFEMRAARSLASVGQELGKSTALIERWSSRYDWVNRAADYDAWLNAQARAAAESRARAEGERWATIDIEIREEKLRLSREMIAKARRMLEFPLATVRTESGPNGETVTIVNPTRWSMNSSARLADVAFELARQAVKNEGSLNENGDEREEEFVFEEYK